MVVSFIIANISRLLKGIGWKGAMAIALVIGILFLWVRGSRFKGKYEAENQQVRQLKLDASLAAAKYDSLKGLGEYSEIRIDTVDIGKAFPDPYPVPGSTIYLEADPIGPEAINMGKIGIDTTMKYGTEDFSFTIHVSGAFHWPKEFKYRNWMTIIPEFQKPPIAPVAARSLRSWGIGVSSVVSAQGALFSGLYVRNNRISMAVMRKIDRKNDWTFGLSYEILRF